MNVSWYQIPSSNANNRRKHQIASSHPPPSGVARCFYLLHFCIFLLLSIPTQTISKTSLATNLNTFLGSYSLTSTSVATRWWRIWCWCAILFPDNLESSKDQSPWCLYMSFQVAPTRVARHTDQLRLLTVLQQNWWAKIFHSISY